MDPSGRFPPPHRRHCCFHHHHCHRSHNPPPFCSHHHHHQHHHHHCVLPSGPNLHFRYLHHLHCQAYRNPSFSPLSGGISPPSNAQLDRNGFFLTVPPGSFYSNEVFPAPEHEEVEDVGEEEDDEPVFVLTDEWREFFAKSEAKRKLEKKKQAAKKN